MESFTRALILGPLLVLIGLAAGNAAAAGLNTDVALTPPEGGTIVRVQWRGSSGDSQIEFKTNLGNYSL